MQGRLEHAPPTTNEATDASVNPDTALHVVPHGDGWGIRVGDGEIERLFRTREDAFHNARAWATRDDRWVVVHGDADPIEPGPRGIIASPA